MSRLPSLKPAEIIRALQRGRFFVHHARGSHLALRHRDHPGLQLTIARHNRELPPGVVRQIVRQARLSEEAFLDLL